MKRKRLEHLTTTVKTNLVKLCNQHNYNHLFINHLYLGCAYYQLLARLSKQLIMRFNVLLRMVNYAARQREVQLKMLFKICATYFFILAFFISTSSQDDSKIRRTTSQQQDMFYLNLLHYLSKSIVLVGQLVERSFLTPEIHGLNPVIGKKYK